MMPRLIAEESLLAAERLGVGTGTIRRQDRRRILNRWRRACQPAGMKTQPVPPAALSAMGIAVREVPRAPRG